MNVGPDFIRLVKSFEGAPRWKARRCEGDAWELGYGSTYYPDNYPVREDDTLESEAQAEEMLAHCTMTELAPVLRALTFTPMQHQIDALASLAYNIGGSAAARSSVVRLANEGRFEDAAAAFGLWSGAKTAFEADGSRVLSKDGKPCVYFRRLRGLLRRHHAEGCLFLGLDWREACADDAVFLRTRREWNAPKNRWEDVIISQTEFKDVHEIARHYPLSSVVAAPMPPAGDEARPAETSAAPAPQPKHAPVVESPVSTPAEAKPVTISVGTKPPSIFTRRPEDVPYRIDPDAGLKPLEDSERAKAFVWQTVARFIIRVGSLGMFGTSFSGVFKLVSEDQVIGTAIMDLFVPAATAASAIVGGLVIKAYADWRRQRGEVTGTQGLY